jgi:hypothetical protein
MLAAVLCVPGQAVEVGPDSAASKQKVWVRADCPVTVRYMHSVERTPVEETYHVRYDGMHLSSMRWQSFSAGLPLEYDACVEGFYVRSADVAVGREIDYWFLPLNDVEISVGERVVFRGPEAPSRVVVRMRWLPLAARFIDAARCAA